MKIALIVGGVVLSVGAVSAIAASVATSQNQSSQTTTPIESADSSSTNSSDAMINHEETKKEQTVINASNIARQINEEDIVVKEKQKETKLSENYAFSLKNKTLEINKNSNKLPNGYSALITIKEEEKNLVELNNGILKVTITVTNEKDKQNDKAEVELVIKSFKKADSKLLNLLDKDKDKTNPSEEYSLTLLPKEEKLAKFVSVEELNKQATQKPSQTKNGLTTLLDDSTFTQEQIKDVSIEGKVKVIAINKEEGKPTLFTLTSSEKNGLLKLVRKEKDVINEALIGSIKTTNLLATSVSIYPTVNEKDASEEFSKKLLDGIKPSNGNGFKNTNNKLQVEIKKTRDSSQETSDVNLTTFVFKPKTEMDMIKVPLGVKVSFGSNDDAYSLDSNIKDQAKILQEAGFSFHIYSRLLEGNDEKTAETLKAVDITTGHQQLEKYFLNPNYKTPVAKPNTDLKDALNPAANSNFVVLNSWTTDFNEGKKLESNKPDENKSKYYLVFADYSYTSAIKKQDMTYELKEKVLYTPNLSLIQVQNMDKASK